MARDEELHPLGAGDEPVGLTRLHDRDVEGRSLKVHEPFTTMNTSGWSWWWAGASNPGGMRTVWT